VEENLQVEKQRMTWKDQFNF